MIQSVLKDLKTRHPDTANKHCDTVLDILLQLKDRVVSITYDESVLIQSHSKHNTSWRFALYYFPHCADMIIKGTITNGTPFCLQVFLPRVNIIKVQTLDGLLSLLNDY